MVLCLGRVLHPERGAMTSFGSEGGEGAEGWSWGTVPINARIQKKSIQRWRGSSDSQGVGQLSSISDAVRAEVHMVTTISLTVMALKEAGAA